MVTPLFPFKLIFPSLSTDTPGEASSISIAVPPAFKIEDSTLIIVLSIFLSINGFLLITFTSFKDFVSAIKEMVPKSIFPSIDLKVSE